MNHLFKLLLLIGSLCIGLATRFGWLKWRNEHYAEEMAEKFIKYETGYEIDLTPATPDPDINLYTDSDEAMRQQIFEEKGWDMVQTPR